MNEKKSSILNFNYDLHHVIKASSNVRKVLFLSPAPSGPGGSFSPTRPPSSQQQYDDVDKEQADEDERKVDEELLQVAFGLRVHLDDGGPAYGRAGDLLNSFHQGSGTRDRRRSDRPGDWGAVLSAASTYSCLSSKQIETEGEREWWSYSEQVWQWWQHFILVDINSESRLWGEVVESKT